MSKVFINANENGDFITIEEDNVVEIPNTKIEVKSSNFNYIKKYWDFDDILTIISSIKLS